MKDKAKEYHQLGLNIVLVNGDKKPLGEWQKRITQQQTSEEFENLPWNEAKGFAVVCGRLNERGLYFGAIDIDVKKVTEEAKQKGEQLRKLLRTTQVEHTPSNGFHYIYYSKQPIMSNSKPHEFCGCELLGKKKLCIMAPSLDGQYRRANDNYPVIVESLETEFLKVLDQIGYSVKKQQERKNRPPYTKKGKYYRIRPCILEIQKKTHMKHEERVMVATEYLANNFAIEEIMPIFQLQEDYGDGSKTKYQLEQIKGKGYQKYNCATIEGFGLCIPSCVHKKVRDNLDLEPIEPWNGDPDELTKEADRHNILEAYGSTIKKDEESTVITFLATLLNYTKEDQQNIIFKSETASGKTHLAVNITKLFPTEDVHYFYNVSPKAFIHEYGELGEKNTHIVDMEKHILVFLDQKKADLIAEMRSILSHDQKIIETKITDRNRRGGHATKTVQIIGFPTWLFCSATAFLNDEDLNRAFLLSATTDKEKLKETLLLLAQKKGNPVDYAKKLEEDQKRKWLHSRIKAIKNASIQYILIPDDLIQKLYDNFIDRHAALTPRHQRDFPRLLALVKAWALFNFATRKRKQIVEGTCIIANENDVLRAQTCYDTIAECNELGVTPETYQLWREIILPNIGEIQTTKVEGKNGQQTFNEEELVIKGLSRREIQQKFFYEHHRSLTKKRLDNALNELIACGLLHEDTGEDKRVKVYKPTFDVKPSDIL